MVLLTAPADVPADVAALASAVADLHNELTELRRVSTAIAAGCLEHQLDFLGDFSTAFNSMVAALREKRRAEQEATHASKMAAIGHLAAGMAHEINTPIHYIGASDDGFANEEITSALADSRAGAQRIAVIVQSMKEFAQPGTSVMTMIDINRIIDNTQIVSRNVWSPAEMLELELDPSLPDVHGQGGEIGQVVLNLVVNAAQAIAEAGRAQPGIIRISTARDGDDLVIRVGDDGPGVPPPQRERIFDLFFTTRPVGAGTGQGLAVCRDIVAAKHGGRIEVGDSPLGGAEFVVRLPIQSTVGNDEKSDFIDDLPVDDAIPLTGQTPGNRR